MRIGCRASCAAHWNGTKWSGSPLPSGLHSEVNAASVVSASSVWAVTEANGDSGQAQLVHFNGTTWTSVKAPYSGITLDFFAPDGHGGFWMDSSASRAKTSVPHYSASGRRSRIAPKPDSPKPGNQRA